ncbi:MAG TPA: MATE family efflux transporter [Acetobacteraceae bacterium]|nr:MATE family efflux transporter [Acetobacteraceae bacterium]
MAGQLSVMGMNTVDVVLAGHLGATVLGAVAVGTALFHIANIAAIGVNAALSPSVAQLDGARLRAEVGPLFRQGLLIAVALGLLLAAFVAFGAPPLTRLLGFPPSLAGPAGDFLHGVAAALPALSLFYACRGLSEGLALPLPTMLFGALGLLLLIPVGYVLMYGALGLPALGAFGSGLATTLVSWTQLAAFAVFLRLSPRYRGLGWRSGGRRPDARAIAGLLRLGGPMAVSMVLESSLFSGAGLAIGTLGAVAVASHQVALNVAAFAFMVPLGVALAVTVRVGQASGRGDTAGLRRAGISGFALVLAMQCLSGGLMLAVPGAIASLYTQDASVRAGAVVLLQLAGIFQLSDGLQVVASGALRGLKDTRVPMLITALAYWIIGMPLGLLLAFGAGWRAPGMWCGLIGGLTTAACLLTVRFFALARRYARAA